MYSKYTNLEESKLHDYHHVKIDQEFKMDCKVWLSFLEADMMSVVARPFVDLNEDRQLTELKFFSDASLNGNLGFGARFQKEWTYGKWPEKFIEECSPSIEFVELFGLTVAVFIWAKKLKDSRSVVFCDNESVVHMINNTSSSCCQCMKLIRAIVLKGLQHNFRIFAKHVRSEDNEIADSLSRLQFTRFGKLMKKFHLRVVPEPLLEVLWPVTKIWNNMQLLN